MILLFFMQFHTYYIEEFHIFCGVLSAPVCLSGPPTSCNIFSNDHHCPRQDTVFLGHMLLIQGLSLLDLFPI